MLRTTVCAASKLHGAEMEQPDVAVPEGDAYKVACTAAVATDELARTPPATRAAPSIRATCLVGFHRRILHSIAGLRGSNLQESYIIFDTSHFISASALMSTILHVPDFSQEINQQGAGYDLTTLLGLAIVALVPRLEGHEPLNTSEEVRSTGAHVTFCGGAVPALVTRDVASCTTDSSMWK
jgi:hypothetical protein